ncbi:FHA domain-containing protein [Agromyces kandeliae]|uniref:FHA domain-containing protein n=1 Tax=Agromyces kandeliae TaxID=2666141 RepID=A0A6L5R5K2_9MICO|nr:FHA domain-containing protein [Agromyces kandeliae]MRX45165.1 FHA domain-containing protein [Agromyces kandeliae]
MSEPDSIVPPPGSVPDEPEAERSTRAEDTGRMQLAIPGFRPPPGVRPPSALPIGPPASAFPAAPPAAERGAVPSAADPPDPPAATGPWHLRSADGIEFSVPDRVVVGRDPKPPAWLQGATVVAIPDHTRSMSKTHALLEVRDGRLLVTDLDSTNGVRVWPEGSDPTDLESGVPAEVPLDAVVLLGDVAFLVERAPADSV